MEISITELSEFILGAIMGFVAKNEDQRPEDYWGNACPMQPDSTNIFP
jgi:hypothetical protein